MMDSARLYILLPVHNRRDITCRFLECLKAQTYRNYHLLLLDDGSTDGTAEAAAQLMHRLTIVKGDGNWWWTGALQAGLRWLKANGCGQGDVILIMNDDTTFEENFLQTGVDILSQKKDLLLLAQCYSRQTGSLLDAGIHADWSKLTFNPPESPGEVNCLSTMGLFLRYEDLQRIGGFHARLLPHFTSDYEFTIRAYRKGFTLATDPKLKLWLDESATWNKAFGEMAFVPFVKALFSKKSPVNPLVFSAFIALACPWRWKLLNWCRVWANACYQLVTHLPQPYARAGQLLVSLTFSPVKTIKSIGQK